MKTEYKTRSKKLRVCDQYIFVLTPFANVAYVFPVNENVPPYRLKFLQDSKNAALEDGFRRFSCNITF